MEVYHNESMSLNETFDSQAVLQRIHDDLVTSYLPLMIWLGITCVIGVVGNIETIVFYGWKTKASSTTIFITWLAASDLLVCAMMIEQIFDLHFNVLFIYRSYCKIKYFIAYAGIYSSAMLLTIISVDRFRKVCRSNNKQFSVKSSNFASLLTVFLCLLFNVRVIFVIDVIDVHVSTLNDPVETTVGNDCSFTKDSNLSTFVYASHATDFIFLLVCLAIMLICYGCLYFHIRKHTQQLSKWNTPAKFNNSSDPTMLSIPTDHARPLAVSHSIGAAERRLTHMMALITLWFLLCYVPYIVVNVFLALNKASADSYILLPGVLFMLRLPYLNSVINPVVFILLNPNYRSFVRRQVILICTCSSLSTRKQEK